jgi:hypothetical protein
MTGHMTLRTILANNKDDLALVIGNGINRYGDSATVNSWDGLLLKLASKYSVYSGEKIPQGIALTEFYDLLNLGRPASVASQISLQEEFCAGMDKWRVFSHHCRIVKWSRDNAIPILTTNFDTVLSRAGDCRLFPERTATSFTDYYPWNRYYGLAHLANPLQGFGIWHINGMQKYRRSIRLGLTDYMGSVARVRGWIHKGNEGLLFAGKDANNWPGVSTWLHIVFNKPLLIFGLGLEENEVFLRWLFIERARYFNKFPDRRRECWYVYTSEKEKIGKLFFLRKLGIQAVKADSYEDLYGASSWT